MIDALKFYIIELRHCDFNLGRFQRVVYKYSTATIKNNFQKDIHKTSPLGPIKPDIKYITDKFYFFI